MRLLLVEDEPRVARFIAKGLRERSYAVDVAPDGDQALYHARENEYDLMILDVMLPHRDGYSVCQELRAAGFRHPILMLTARDAVDDRVRGLDAGADDYLTKPFDFGELLARLRALLRRGPAGRPPELRVGEVRVDPATHEVTCGEQRVELDRKSVV